MAYDLRNYNPGRPSLRIQPSPARQAPGIISPGMKDAVRPLYPSASEISGSAAYSPPEIPRASQTGTEQIPAAGASRGSEPSEDLQANTVQARTGQTNTTQINTAQPGDFSAEASEAGAWKHILDLDPESVLKGILFSEILGKPKSMRRGRR